MFDTEWYLVMVGIIFLILLHNPEILLKRGKSIGSSKWASLGSLGQPTVILLSLGGPWCFLYLAGRQHVVEEAIVQNWTPISLVRGSIS